MAQEETIKQEKTKKERLKIFNSNWVVKNIPYFLFLGLIAVLYIYNGHLADKLSRKISESERHIKELEFEFKSVKSEVIFRSKPSELAKAVEPLGLKEALVAPVVLDTSKVK